MGKPRNSLLPHEKKGDKVNRILYKDKKRCLCEKCSKIGIEIPVRDKSSIEFQDCSICQELVRYESIYCNLCQHLVHPYCNGKSKYELRKFNF